MASRNADFLMNDFEPLEGDMCQAFESEKRSLIAVEQTKLRRKWEAHESGERPLSQDEINELVVRKIMLDDA